MSLLLTVAITSGAGACLHPAKAVSRRMLAKATGLQRLKKKASTCNLVSPRSPSRLRMAGPGYVAPVQQDKSQGHDSGERLTFRVAASNACSRTEESRLERPHLGYLPLAA